MRKIIPLIVLVMLSALFTNAQNNAIDQAEKNVALQIVDANKAVIGLTADQLKSAIVLNSYEDKTTGMRYVYLQQSYKNIQVYNQILVLAFKKEALVSKAGFFDPSIEKAVNVSSGSPAVTAESAVQSALSDRGLRAAQMAVAINRKEEGRFIEFGDMGISRENITARLTWVPNEVTKQYHLAWQVYIIPKTTSDYWMVRVNAMDNSILGMDNYTDYDHWGIPEGANHNIKYPAFAIGNISVNALENNIFDFKKSEDPDLVTTATYRVVPFPAESPWAPGGIGSFATRTDPWTAAPGNATTLRWHTGAAAADYDYSRGNNVWAYEDRTAPTNTGTIAKSAASSTAFPNLTFNFIPDTTVDPTQNTPVPNQRFNITNLFYWNNIIHDVMYIYGFTEAARNFQDDNLGRGGAGNDHVNAEAQDAGGTNNANFATPADGGSGRMQMYLWNLGSSNPLKDGDVDNGIIVHEYGHGISNRLTGSGSGCLSNAEQMGEGWSDYYALMFTQNWATSNLNTGFNTPRGIGLYALNGTNLFGASPPGTGIRHFPYCTNFAINGQTYAASIPSSPHDRGEIWCATLWDMTWNIINQVGVINPNIYDLAGGGGNTIAMKLVTEGLKLQQCSPGFISGRNAILAADQALYGGLYRCAIIQAFARRGMGTNASEGSTSSVTDQVVDFTGGGPVMAFTQSGAGGVAELQNIVYNHAITAECTGITNFTLRDTLPLNVNFVSATNGGTYAGGTRVVSWPVNVALNATQNYGLTVQIAAGSYFPPVVLINEPVPSTTISGFWTTSSTTANVWTAHNVRSNSAPNSFFTPNAGIASDQIIATTASFAIGATAPVLSFWHWYNSEPSWDGGVLEISLNGGGSWADIGAANFIQNGYNGTLNNSANPIGGRSAWTGNSAAFIESKVNMTPYANQANVKLRWRFGSDGSVAATGWNVDDITLQTIAVVNMRTSLFNGSNVRVNIRDTSTIILPPSSINPDVTINQAVAQPDPTTISPINFTVVFSQPVIGFATGDVTLSGTAGATTGTVTGGPTTFNVAVSGMTGSGTVIASIAPGVCTNAALDPNNASTSTDNTVTYNVPPPGCITTVSFTGPPVAILDNTPAGVDIPLIVSGVGTIADLNFRLDPGAGACDNTIGNIFSSIDHTWNSDVIVRLTSPSATTVTLINQRGGSGNNFCLVTLDDDGAFPPTSTMPTTGAIAGNYAPENPLSAFDGQNANGTWILNVSDVAAGDAGFVRGFSLVFTGLNPTMNPIANDTVCNNSLAGPYNFTSPNAGATFTWTNSNPAIGLPANGVGNIAAFNATNATTAPINATITVTPSVGICVGIPVSFIIRVNPSGQVNQIANQVLCRGASTTAVNFTSTVPGTIFSWSNNNTLIGLAATGQGNIPSFIAQNPTGVPQVATITVNPTYGSGGIQVTQNFNFTGAVQTFVVPAGVTSINVKTWGAQGNSNAQSSAIGGLGGYAEGTLAVTPGQTLYINAGGGGTASVTGGFNGGGDAGANTGCATARGGGGGGATDVRVGANTLGARAIVAAGGGGGGGNRVAGCGRGTGGGGGAGYYGGGGGAAWPGVPGSQGPVPTGGTQAAGGAGGVTTFSPGPTNGFAGALGIGGAGGTEVGSNQGGSAVAQPGGIGGGLTGASGLYNQANNWTGQSGAGGSSYIGGVSAGITNPGVNSGNGRVEFTFAAGGLACAGTPMVFTITVNPNQDLIIVADPGTTICNGDPTLLTVYNVGASSPPGNLVNQPGPGTNGSPSQVFEPANAAFSSQAADDFTVPGGATWTITQLNVVGTNTGSGVPTSVNVFFYANSGSNLPGAAIASYTNLASFVRTGGNYAVTLPAAGLNLSAGTYWVSFQVNMSFATSGQWFWSNYGTTNIGNQYAWQNPGGGFATPCTSWGYGATGCNVGGGANRNNIFTLIGSSVTPGTIATGTFLWSPAAGLSSTTSNPVAASPMTTTTYTVVRTTVPGGCVASAQVTVTVNQRPTVTTQPVSSTNCVGNTVTFTVAGTGTGLAYQWQVSPTGCGGPWTNLTNTAPYSGVNTGVLTITPATQLLNGYAYRAVLTGVCAPIGTANISNCVILTVNPNPNVSITPPVSCGGVAGISGTALTVGSAPPPVPGQSSANSGAISVVIPDGSGAAAISNLNIAGIPANATITEIKVNMTMTHTWVGDVDVNLRAPNNAILNLVGGLDGGTGGNSSDNFTNTAFSSIGGATISGAPAPRTGTFAAEARAGFGPIGYIQTVTTWAGLTPTAPSANGQWTLAMGDFAGGDVGTLTNWSITIDYTTPGGGGGPTLTYVWSPLAGLYTNATATIPYTGGNTPIVYAAPTALTVYTVRATDVATGCFTDATAIVNYTPPAPTVIPSSVTMCLGDPAVKLKSSSSTTSTATFTSGTISVPIPEGAFPTGPYVAGTSTIPVAGIPAGANISRLNVRMNITHPYVGDVVAVLRAPNGQIFNLDALLNATNNAGANFVNTVISSAGTTALSAGTAPWTGTFRADAVGATFTVFGFTLPGGPVGFIPTTQTWSALYSTPNGNWTLALYDAGAPDLGTLTNWSMDIEYVLGVPATPAVWSPAAGLFSDALATTPYVAGTAVDSVWTRPAAPGVYPYQVTVQNLITTTSNPATPTAGGNGQALVTFNVTNNNTIPVTFNSISSRVLNSGPMTATVFYKTTPIAGPPGAISAANGWTQFGTGPSVGVANAVHQLLTGLTLVIPPGATYGIAIQGLTAGNAANIAYTNGGGIVTYTDGGCTITTGGNVGYGGVAAPGAPTFNPRNFNGTVRFLGSGAGTCTSPARTVIVTVHTPTSVTTQPVSQTICTDKVATFTAAGGGSGPFTYQWQVSTAPCGNNPPCYTNITNGGVYSGATTATLTITRPPVSMSGNFYRVIINGAAPCAPATSFGARLTVNPLPTVVITANPYTSLMPGLTTTLSSTVTPNAAASYSWLLNGVPVAGANSATLLVDVDNLGNYSLLVTDVNGCTNTSNIITIKDSASAKCFIYPNPTSGKFQVRYYSVANNVLPRTLTIYDAKGDRVFTQYYTIGRPYDRMDVDMRAYGKGLYWVEIGDLNGNRLTMCRVVIQ